ncbi:MAG: Gfo/Idh/MocA family oxidoreductase [Candidatus Hydrogenedentes bacterium]|nr:Gfo/Idh/MocA family oxidoreductase [Candidatus Hydrogenedentota bacterium]
MNRRTFLSTASTAALAASLAAPARAQDKKYKACIIGDSDQGGYGHDMHLAFALRDDVALVGLADPNEEGRAKRAAECGAERSYASYQEMLEKEKPDLVAIGPRWTINHKDYLTACVAAGAHGFMEKPLCTDLAEADAMVAMVKEKNLKWSIAFNFRVTPTIAHVKAMIWEKELVGSLLEIRGRGKEDARAGGEDLIVLGTHIFDMMRYFANDPLWCAADITQNGKPATPADVREATEPLGPVLGNRIHAMYGFEKGVAGHFSSMRTKDGDGGRWGIQVLGSKGVISIGTGVEPNVWWLNDSTWNGAGRDSKWERLPEAPAYKVVDQAKERHQILVNDLLAAIEADREPVASLNDGLKSQEMVQAVYEAYTQGRRVALPLEQRDHPLKRWA